jgi:hypothetical protein
MSAAMKKLIVLAATLAVALSVIGASLTRQPATVPISDHSTERSLYHWDSTLQRWVGPQMTITFGITTANYQGALKIGAGNFVSDSTAATEHGWRFVDDFLVKRVHSFGNYEGGSIIDSYTLLMATGQDTVVKTPVLGADAEHDTTLTYTLATGDFLSCYTIFQAGPNQIIDDPCVVIYGHPLTATLP